ncbi:MAG: hypothetical protein ACOY0T_00840 [Myxococcota bacterium]
MPSPIPRIPRVSTPRAHFDDEHARQCDERVTGGAAIADSRLFGVRDMRQRKLDRDTNG